jgi:DNA-binding response OmpR family regulator
MKILYFAQERSAAELVSRALRRVAPAATLAWARSPEAALNWLSLNRDVDAVLADASLSGPPQLAFLEQVRGMVSGITTAVLAPQHLETLSAALQATLDAAAHQERARNEVLEAQLKEVQEWRQQTQERLLQVQADHDGALKRTTRICTTLQ